MRVEMATLVSAPNKHDNTGFDLHINDNVPVGTNPVKNYLFRLGAIASRMRVLTIASSFRMHAVSATILHFPAATNRS
jgi:hypothetical protein